MSSWRLFYHHQNRISVELYSLNRKIKFRSLKMEEKFIRLDFRKSEGKNKMGN